MKKYLALIAVGSLVLNFLVPLQAVAYSSMDQNISVQGVSDDQWVSGTFNFDVTAGRPNKVTNSVSVSINDTNSPNFNAELACGLLGVNVPIGETITTNCSVNTLGGFTSSTDPKTQKNFVDGQRYVIWIDVHPNWSIGMQSFRVDNEAPTIDLVNKNLNITLERGVGTYTEEGGTISDKYSGVNGELEISSNLNTNVAGEYHVIYTARDNAGNKTVINRKITVSDTIAPVLTLKGEAKVTLVRGGTFTDPGATTDDGSEVSVLGSVDPTTAGTYILTYTAIDPSGNVADSITRTVTVLADPIVLVTSSTQAVQATAPQNPGSASVPATGVALVAQGTQAANANSAVKGSTDSTAKVAAKNAAANETKTQNLNWLWLLLGLLVAGTAALGYRSYKLKR